MTIIADSGSTCTNWVIINSKDVIANFNTKGFNPYFTQSEEITNELRINFPSDIESKEIEKVYFYGAGCSSEALKNVIYSGVLSFFANSEIYVENDLLGAARALFQNEKGIAVILGTGSNTCYYNGIEITKNVTSLGYILGDEGGGDYMGKLLIQSVLNKDLPEKIIKDFYSDNNLNSKQILNAIYKEEYPNRFLASFAKYIKKHSNIAEFKDIIIQAFTDLFEKHICKYESHLTTKIRAAGSVAYYFKDELEFVAKNYNCKFDLIEKKPINLLVKYHLNNPSI